GPLSAQERQTVESLREFLTGVSAIPRESPPTARADRMGELCEALLGQSALRIGAATLCSKVAGFGQYTPLGASRFQQGVPLRAIVYAEVANFGHRTAAESSQASDSGDRWSVELSQSLLLYHDADGVLAWSRPEERIDRPA